MPQMPIRRPFGELDLRDQLRFEPHAVFHICSFNRILAGANALKALGVTSGVNELSVFFSVLLVHLVRPCQYVGRNGQADLLGSFQIDDELELHRLFDRKVSWFGTF